VLGQFSQHQPGVRATVGDASWEGTVARQGGTPLHAIVQWLASAQCAVRMHCCLGTNALGKVEEAGRVHGGLDVHQATIVLTIVFLLPVGEITGDVVDIVAGHVW